MRLVKFERIDGNVVLINPEMVLAIAPIPVGQQSVIPSNNTEICSAAGIMHVRGHYEDIKEKLEGCRTTSN